MGGKRQAVPAEFAVQGEVVIRTARVKRRRARSRDYMKKWRANPKHRALERERRDRDYILKKERSARRLLLRPYTRVDGQPQCGFCRLGRPVEIVERLRISKTADGEFEKVLIPYCGHC
jgi:hypothetical protein